MSERLYPELFPRPRCVISVQARMASKRLPGKVLAQVMGRPLLSYQLERLQGLWPVVVAVPATQESKPIAEMVVREMLLPIVRAASHPYVMVGPEDDVPARHLRVAERGDVDFLGFCGADQVFVSAEHFAIAFRRLAQGDCDYVRIVGLPHGLHVWAVTRAALEACVADNDRTPDEIEHTGAYWDARPERFRTVDIDMGRSRAYRLTVDTPEDLEVHRLLIEGLPDPITASVDDIIALMDAHPEWAAINANVGQYYWQGAANRPRAHA